MLGRTEKRLLITQAHLGRRNGVIMFNTSAAVSGFPTIQASLTTAPLAVDQSAFSSMT